jgi:magnesium transporter
MAAMSPVDPPPVEASSRSAIDYAVRSVPTAGPGDTVEQVRDSLRGKTFDAVPDVVVLEGDRAVGILSLEELLEAEGSRSVGGLLTAFPAAVTADTGQEAAAHAMVRGGSRSLVVTAPDGSFAGLVPAERMLAVLLSEHDEDLARLGGYAAGATMSRGAATEPVARRLWHRLPWLLLGVVGAMASVLVMGAFDAQLEENVIVAFFVPAIVYMAAAVGTQTQTVLVRALATGMRVRAMVARELVTGVVLGIVVGLAFFIFVIAGWDDVEVALAVGVALAVSAALATAVAMVLPALFQRFGGDPAFGSGPLATVIQDLLSILVYLVAVALIVG